MAMDAAGNGPVLEIGCGSGSDTTTLAAMGLSVHAFDVAPEAAAEAARAVPSAQVSTQSVLEPFPLEGTGIGLVVASLSLHYFPWGQTISIMNRICSTLRVGGVLLARFNSDQDANHGASGYPEVEPGMYLVDGQTKRFFAEHDVQRLFAHRWQMLSCEHLVSHKYALPKALWEVVARRLT